MRLAPTGADAGCAVPPHLVTRQHGNAKAAFQNAAAIIQHAGIGTAMESWLDDHVVDFPRHELDAEVTLTGWLAAALVGLPLSE